LSHHRFEDDVIKINFVLRIQSNSVKSQKTNLPGTYHLITSPPVNTDINSVSEYNLEPGKGKQLRWLIG